MKLLWQILSVALLMILAAACASTKEDADTAVPNKPDGPALIMFYTEN